MNETTRHLLDIIRDRRSYPLKDVAPDPIDLDDVRTMLEAANWAPTHGMTEPWRFAVISGDSRRELGEHFAEAYRLLTPQAQYKASAEQAQRERPFLAPVWISLGLWRTEKSPMPEWEDLASVAIAAQHIHLVATSMGYACKWTSGDIVRHPAVLAHVGLEAPSKLMGFLYLGKPAPTATLSGRRSPIDTKVTWSM